MVTKKRTNEEWVEIYYLQRSSGLTMKQWCAENDVNIYTMADRVTRLRKMGLIEAQQPVAKKSNQITLEPSGWVEVRQGSKSFENIGINIKVGSFTITVPEEFQEAALIRVCRALISIC